MTGQWNNENLSNSQLINLMDEENLVTPSEIKAIADRHAAKEATDAVELVHQLIRLYRQGEITEMVIEKTFEWYLRHCRRIEEALKTYDVDGDEQVLRVKTSLKKDKFIVTIAPEHVDTAKNTAIAQRTSGCMLNIAIWVVGIFIVFILYKLH